MTSVEDDDVVEDCKACCCAMLIYCLLPDPEESSENLHQSSIIDSEPHLNVDPSAPPSMSGEHQDWCQRSSANNDDAPPSYESLFGESEK